MTDEAERRQMILEYFKIGGMCVFGFGGPGVVLAILGLLAFKFADHTELGSIIGSFSMFMSFLFIIPGIFFGAVIVVFGVGSYVMESAVLVMKEYGAYLNEIRPGWLHDYGRLRTEALTFRYIIRWLLKEILYIAVHPFRVINRKVFKP